MLKPEDPQDPASDIKPECASFPSPDVNVRDPTSGSLTEDLWLHSEQLVSMVKALQLDYNSPDLTSSDLVMSALNAAEQGPVTLLMLKGRKEAATNAWARPVSGQDFLFHHLTASTLVTEVLASKQREVPHSLPLGNATHAGKKDIYISSLGSYIASFKATMGHYPMFLSERMSQHLEGLPEDK